MFLRLACCLFGTLSMLTVASSTFDYFHRYQDPGFSAFGTTGLLQMPSARFHEEGTVGMAYQKFDPYTRLAMIGYPFNWIETIYHYTDISDRLYSPVKEFSGNQTYKDKGFDIKILLSKESKKFPQIALGLRDLAGTGFFASEYIVASKRMGNFDFTYGIGWGQLNKNSITNPISKISKRFEARPEESDPLGGKFSTFKLLRGKNAGNFFGIEYFSKRLKNTRFLFEIDSTNYQKEGLSPQPQDSKYNFGITKSFSKQVNFYAGFIRGNTFKLGFSIKNNYGLKNPNIPKYDSPKKLEKSEAIKIVTAQDKTYLYRALLRYLPENNIYPQQANAQNNKLSITFNQNAYINYSMAVGRTIDILDQISPEDISEFELIPLNGGFSFTGINITRQAYNSFKDTKDFNSLNESIEYRDLYKNNNKFEFQPANEYPAHLYSIGPGIQSHIGGPDRFFVGGLSLVLDSNLLLRRNITIDTVARIGVVNAFDILEQASDSILPHVRTDIIEYLKQSQDQSIARMQMNIHKQLSSNIYSKVSVGIFEEMFGGYGGEILYRPFGKLWALGLDVYKVKQRDFDQMFDYRDYETLTGHATFYLFEPKYRILTKISGGRYLAEDSGFTFDMSRIFKSGFKMGVYFSLTDISAAEFGEGSFDKGFYINIPLQSFFTNYRGGFTNFGLRPLTRDGAAKLLVGDELWGLTGFGSEYNYRLYKHEIYN